ncbi:MAG: YaiO family outer membrane beta-barrel protein [Myxococcales bacterium]|nr:YaiO family outer membrane beta-barrel protein [Myxococcales bacterium]MCB9532229.1 YaiO family outer membrane beta-barrel protein [Myxococcales bacterium]
MRSDARRRATRAALRGVVAVAFSIAFIGAPMGAARAETATSSLKVAALVAAARAADDAGDTAARRQWSEAAVKASPDDVDVLFMAGRFASFDGDYDVAISRLQRATTLAPKYVDVRVHLARVLGWATRFDEARDAADAVLVLRRRDRNALELRGDVAAWAGDHRDAAGWYAMASVLAPDDVALLWKVIGAYAEADDGDAVRAYLALAPRSEDDRGRAMFREQWAASDPDGRTDASLAYTFTDPGDWVTFMAGASARVISTVWIGGRAEWQRRNFAPGVNTVDTTLAFPIAATVARRLVLSVEPAFTPRADVNPSARVTTEVAYDANALFGFIAGYRFAEYDALEAHTLYPTLSFHVWPVTIEPTLLATWTPSGTDLTGRLKLTLDTGATGRVELWGHVGTEPLEPSVARTLSAPLQAGMLVAVTRTVRPLSQFRFTYAFSAPVDADASSGPAGARVYRRHTLALSWTQRFRLRGEGRR